MAMLKEFKEFLLKQNVVALAIAVVIATALTTLVKALVDDFVMPIVVAIGPGGEWQKATWSVGSVKFGVGDFIAAAINFVIIGSSQSPTRPSEIVRSVGCRSTALLRGAHIAPASSRRPDRQPIPKQRSVRLRRVVERRADLGEKRLARERLLQIRDAIGGPFVREDLFLRVA